MGVGLYEKPICRGNCLKRGLGQFADLRGSSASKGGVFERDVDSPIHTMAFCA